MKINGQAPGNSWNLKELLLQKRWPWHLAFWLGYILFRFWLYYITVEYYPVIYLQYMLLSELLFVGMTYFTLWLYRKLFEQQRFLVYFMVGAASWLTYLYCRTVFQFYYLKNAPGFQNNSFPDIFINNVTVVIVYFLFITSCKYFKDGYIRQQFEAVKKEQQLMAEVNNLKSQIAPHFLFNTLNNLYGLAVEKSDKLPQLMLRLSDLLRFSLYETQKPLVPIQEEMDIIKSYIELEKIRLEEDLQLEVNDTISTTSDLKIAPLLLIVFVENAFKHAKYVQGEAVQIYIDTSLEKNLFTLRIRNNYNPDQQGSVNGIGLINVQRRLDVLYPAHQFSIRREHGFYIVELQLTLTGSA